MSRHHRGLGSPLQDGATPRGSLLLSSHVRGRNRKSLPRTRGLAQGVSHESPTFVREWRKSRNHVPSHISGMKSRRSSQVAVLSVPVPIALELFELSQPDSSRSDALLGMCTTCPAWFLVSGRDGIIRDLGLSELLGPPRPPKKAHLNGNSSVIDRGVPPSGPRAWPPSGPRTAGPHESGPGRAYRSRPIATS